MTKPEKMIALISVAITSVFILQFSFNGLVNAFTVFDGLVTSLLSTIMVVGIFLFYISMPLLILRGIWKFISN